MDTITRMRAFVAVVESGGFSAAARGAGRSFVSKLAARMTLAWLRISYAWTRIRKAHSSPPASGWYLLALA